MIKVLVYGISGNIGGIEKLIYNVITNTPAENISFDIITFYDSIAYQAEYEKIGVGIHKITSKRENYFKNKKGITEFFNKHASEFTAVWCNLAELINIDILKLAKKYGIKMRIIHSHSIGSTRGNLLTKLHYFNKKKIDKFATDFWACSLPAAKWFYSSEILNSPSFRIINNAVDTKEFSYNPPEREKIRKELGITNEFVLGHIGRLQVIPKNQLFLLDVFNEILKLIPHSRLVLVGDGPDRQIIEKRIIELNLEKQVILTGFRKDTYRLYNAFDAFVLPSFCEGLGIVLIEAQCNGLKCYASAKRIPEAVAVTDLVNFIDLDSGAGKWAKKIANDFNGERKSHDKEVADAGFEIKTQAKVIEKIFGEEK